MKITFLFILVLLISLSSHAQFSIGGQIGINSSKIEFENLTFTRKKIELGPFIGMNSSFAITEKINLLGDLQFSSRRFISTNRNQDIYIRNRVESLDLQPKIEFRLNKYIGIVGGVNAGLNVGSYTRFEIGSDEWNRNGKSSRNSANMALIGALRIHVKNIFLEAGYFHGLSDIRNATYRDVNGELIDNVKESFRSFQFGIGYLFEL